MDNRVLASVRPGSEARVTLVHLIALLPLYWLLERVPSTRDGAQRLGLVTHRQMVNALIAAVEDGPEGARGLDVPAIRARGKATAIPCPRTEQAGH